MLMQMRQFVTGYRIIFGLLGLSAIVTEIVVLIERGKFNPANFFSFFTIEANIFAVIAFIFGALVAVSGKNSHTFALFRGAATLYMMITGIVFSILLAGLDVELTAVPWDNIVLHYIIPIVVILDWMIDPPKVRISFKQGLLWVVFPLAYLVYTLIRGGMVGWYPYPFLNPSTEGYANVILTAIAITIVTTGLVWVLVRVTQLRKRLSRS